ncbi:tetratricopeptide repeat protein [Lactobacillus sp. LL6]|uniref:tetratricopeptide repeat protein n=1 Tax=Lactobacillus sp. LL6 TaxID=2596827 RepID=UPI0011850EDA|nr:tetratricopeptide repeat protein [Lactobacillus sp. LL6]TSO26201.1 tetratricopeptide repeat protein [Lactobacillus sp. LL6]
MESLSQKNLMKLAKQNEEQGNIGEAIQNLEEALRISNSLDIVLELCRLYRKNKQEDQAYALIKAQPDLFSNKQVSEEYFKILQANNFLIEALQLENILGEKIPVKIEPVDVEKQKKIMELFKSKKQISQFDYEQLLKLDLVNYKNFAQSLLLDPTQNFAVRLSLCEDLVRLGIKEKIKVWVLGHLEEFIPKNTTLLEKNPIYQEVISSIGSRYRNNPSQLPVMLGEANLALGSLYPQISKYITNPDNFAKDLTSYLEKGNGEGNQELLEKIYANLPNN